MKTLSRCCVMSRVKVCFAMQYVGGWDLEGKVKALIAQLSLDLNKGLVSDGSALSLAVVS